MTRIQFRHLPTTASNPLASYYQRPGDRFCSAEDPNVGLATLCVRLQHEPQDVESRKKKKKGKEADQETPDTLTWWQT